MVLPEGRRGQSGYTSYDIGLRHTQPPLLRVDIGKDVPLPPVLQRRARVLSGGGPSRSVTTSGSAHSGALQAAWQAQPLYPKPPPHWSTHCLNDLAKRLRESPSLRVVSAPVSEAKHSYRGFPGLKASGRASDDTLLEHFHQALYGRREHMPRAVEPLISTSHAHHRRFKRSEILGMDISPSNRWKISAHVHPPLRKPPPVSTSPPPPSSSSSCTQHLFRPLVMLPFAGKSSEYQDSFSVPPPHPAPTGPQASALPQWEDTNAGGQIGTEPGDRFGAVKHILEVPKMYVTESSCYGCEKTTLV